MVGIIGGMGSFAGLRLVEYALRKAVANGATTDDQFPRIVYYNLPASGMGISGVCSEKALFKDIRSTISQLETIGCNRIVIACASAHTLWPKLQGNSPAKIFNIVELGCWRSSKFGDVGVMCSESSRKSGMFDVYLKSFGASCIYPKDEDQPSINQAIESVIVNKQGRNEAIGLQSVIFNLRAMGAKGILLGCTELGLAIDPTITSVQMVDAGCVAIDEALADG